VPLGQVDFGGAGVAFGDELAADGFQVGSSCDQLCPLWSLDLGAELQSQTAPAAG